MAGDNHALKIIYDHLVSYQIEIHDARMRSFITSKNEKSENKDKINRLSVCSDASKDLKYIKHATVGRLSDTT